jgi:predicted nucleic acid-binding Zn ribbon protein
MPEKYDHTLKEVIERLLKAYKWEAGIDEAKLVNSWENIVGKIIAKHTTRLKVSNRILYINVDSSVIRNELMMSRSKLIDRINEEMGGKMIAEIVLR